MSTFGDDLIQAMNEALAFTKGEGPGIVHEPVKPRDVRAKIGLTQEQMAQVLGMSVSGYRKWEQGARAVSGPATNLLRVLDKNPKAVLDALAA